MIPLPWNQYKDIIISLYARHTLDEVVIMMDDNYHFKANARTYQKKFEEWGVGKRMNSRSRQLAIMPNGECVSTNSHRESDSDMMTASVDVAAASPSVYTEPGNLYPYMEVASYALDSELYQGGQGQYGYAMNMSDTAQFDVSQLLLSQIAEEHYPSTTTDQAGGTFASLPQAESEVQSAGYEPPSTAAAYQQVGLWPDNQSPRPESILRSHRWSRSHHRSSRSNRSRD
ncbi:uncharacterized protein G6M90_00g039100 [Metarhizium brunneum]|uniref:Clr5 domain-containing protein n=1 Tax=Metarhizium brunneum TaxID=500148 RepID=A0A7D5Z3L6_9HYPO|nr:hypothetical protein G6M90_00g039100 [Metarhizium brunneum]